MPTTPPPTTRSKKQPYQTRFQSSSSVEELAKKEPSELLIWAQRELSPPQQKQLAELLLKGTNHHHQQHAATGVATAIAGGEAAAVMEPSRQALQIVALTTGIPFVGFGILDNALLIVAGDAIDTSLGVVLGISTMCAAAIGNIISDIAGLMFGTAIEDFCATRLNLPTVDLTSAQRRLRSVRFASQLGCGIGLTIGCIIGMFPLLLLDSKKVQAKKRQAHLEAMFKDVVTEAGSLVGAAKTTLYILANKVDDDETKSLVPDANGQFLYNKYSKSEKWIPLGRGLLSRAALTGDSWNFPNVKQEPDFVPAMATPDAKSMLCVPIVDSTGRPIAVLQAINNEGQDPFGENDEQILKALASHISVSLQRLYDDEEDASTRIKDTIQMLKDYKLSGMDTPTKKSPPLRPLFPEDEDKIVKPQSSPRGFCS
jgi:putative methionine-R-sulfoxide reductase with GAF domain